VSPHLPEVRAFTGTVVDGLQLAVVRVDARAGGRGWGPAEFEFELAAWRGDPRDLPDPRMVLPQEVIDALRAWLDT
jgi:hypothetical protein